ncbi:hypothetical protein [Hyphomicrobium sp. CS1BSMeth3]|uniref:hypothetical protein n=1 Tax=Hyphomicrobium sp. CS1BSMeth3 TaxID=1892844 RepID=UPI0009301AC7|nr:hypothetical protein [Hyphomicrobium sp. CS1BSMeth3]
MSYRGNDLDLKVPAGRVRSASGSTGDTTLWVDETLLACCNNAFDLALAYGAGEVRLAHLIHALTRVEAAVRILEQRAISAARLRHESAALIVNESPVPLTSERQSPRRSVEFEDVLRRAVDTARRRGSAAGIEDVLHALLTGNRANPAVDLLQRLAPELPEVPVLAEPTARLALIEDTLRGIHAELAGDRRLLSDIVRDLQREVAGHRGESASHSTALVGRLAELERHLGTAPEIGEKLQSIEQAVQGGMGEGARTWAAIEQRLESLEAAVRATDLLEPITRRLTAVEQTLQDRTNDSVRSWVALADRVQSLEKLYQAGSTEAVRQWSALSQGNAEILKSLTQHQGAPIDGGVLTERLELIERTVRSGFGDTVRSNALLADRVGVVERVIGTRNDTDTGMQLDERLRALETSLDGRARETGGRWLELVDRLAAIEGRISGIAEKPATAVTALAPLPSAEDLAKPVVGYLSKVAVTTAERDDNHARAQARAMAEIGGRVAALEHVVQANNAAVNAAARVYDRNTDELHEGFVRLSENQHTLASAIGDWRDDSTSELRRIAGSLDRLKAVEDRLESLSRYFTAPPARALPATSEAYAPPERSAAGPALGTPLASVAGFRRWLFGTDDVGRANASADLRWQRMRDEVRSAADRLRKR